MITTKFSVLESFDETLWKGGVDDGAFSGQKDHEAKWYTLEVDGTKVALAGVVPGPGELASISYYVSPAHRGLGYATKLASHVTALHKNATFTIFKANEASVKVAIAALRNKFSMTLGHHVVRLTKEAAEKKEEKKPAGPPLITLVDDAAMILKGLKSEAPAAAEVAVKAAASERFIRTRLVARDLANRKNVSGYALGEASKAVGKAPLEDPRGEARKALRGAVAFTRKITKSTPKTTEFVGKIKDQIGNQERMF